MQQLSKRLLSIDVLRAVTMLLMIFVNDVSDVKNIPEWIDHAKASQDALGFADTIFPAFLFIVGLSLPFAINARIKKGDSAKGIVFYILSRSLALLVMGFYQVNLEEYNSSFSILPKAVWAILVTIAFFMIWLDYPETFAKTKKHIIQISGVLILIIMAVLYKGGEGDNVIAMHPSWWGILGIIGWSYLVCALIFYFSKGKGLVLALCLLTFIAFNISIHFAHVKLQLPVVGDGSSVALVLGGVLVSQLFAYLVKAGKSSALWLWLNTIGISTLLIGLFIRPYTEGISKIHSTPSWIVICIGITTLAFEFFIYLIDVKGKKDWFAFIAPAGTSTLTCYLMPYFQVYLLKLFHVKYPVVFYNGIPGILRSVFISLLLIWLVGLMEKRHLRLKI